MEFKEVVGIIADIVNKANEPKEVEEMIIMRLDELSNASEDIKFHISEIGDVTLVYKPLYSKFTTSVLFEKSLR